MFNRIKYQALAIVVVAVLLMVNRSAADGKAQQDLHPHGR